jgi:hypothetical protein
MSSDDIEKNALNLFGVPSKGSNNPQEIPSSANPSTAPTTAWEVYNKRAIIIDRELIKDWNASLSTLLVFVSTLSFDPVV